MIASCSNDRTVDFGTAWTGPAIGSGLAALPLGDRLRVDAMTPGQGPHALLTMLYRSRDRLCRCGAPVENLSYSASFSRSEKYAPSNAGTKHLVFSMPGSEETTRTNLSLLYSLSRLILLLAERQTGMRDEEAIKCIVEVTDWSGGPTVLNFRSRFPASCLFGRLLELRDILSPKEKVNSKHQARR